MNSPYRLPNGPVAIQFSGGRSSGYMLWHILQAHDGQLPPDCHVLFQNTGREMPETLDFVQACSDRWSVPVVWIEYRGGQRDYELVGHNSASRNGEPFERAIEFKQHLPNVVARWCTALLKVRPAIAYMLDQGHKHWHAALGIRGDEAHRANPNDRSGNHTNFYPMVRAGVGRHDVVDWWKRQPFDLRLPSFRGKTRLGNCDGCPLKPELVRAYLARYRPDRAQWWADMEARTGHTFARQARGQQTWAQLIAHAQRQPDWVFDLDDADSLYCTADFGACTE